MRVALEAEYIPSRAGLRLEFRGMRIMADQALAILIWAMKHGVLLGRMATRTQLASRGEQSYHCFVVFRYDVVADLATHLYCIMDEPAFLLFGMAGQAGLSLDVLGFNEGMLNRFFSKNSER
jgi:hypothetical protein